MLNKLELDESQGEIICPVCKGKGSIPLLDPNDKDLMRTCKRCQGKGKLDWIEAATGVAPQKYFQFDSSSCTYSSPCHTHHDETYINFEKEIVERMANQLAKQIDKELIASIANPWEQIKKKHFKGGFK